MGHSTRISTETAREAARAGMLSAKAMPNPAFIEGSTVVDELRWVVFFRSPGNALGSVWGYTDDEGKANTIVRAFAHEFKQILLGKIDYDRANADYRGETLDDLMSDIV